MIKLTNEQLRKLQLIELEMIEEVHRICEKHNIKYSIIGGTLLGAVRHKGFIPWDDDADIAMLREEYEKFRNICKKELDKSKFCFQDYRNTKGYRWGYAKIRRKDTLFLREYQEDMPYNQGIFIDIFPVDYVPNNIILRSIRNFECYCIRKILWSVVGRHVHKNIFLKSWYNILTKIPEETIKKILKNLEKKSNIKKSKYVRNLMFPCPNRVFGYSIDWYKSTKKYFFENKEFYGPLKARKYLKFKYGNYMELPPENQRKVHPVTKIKLLEEIDIK